MSKVMSLSEYDYLKYLNSLSENESIKYIKSLSDDDFLKYLKNVFLNKQYSKSNREIKIMSMLQYRYED